MINRFNKILLVFFLLFFFQPSFADELEINSKTVEIDRSNQIIIAEGNVELTDSQDNLIKSKKVEIIGSGYTQMIGPLVPESVNHWNHCFT